MGLARRRGDVIPLTRTEWRLLRLPAENAGKVTPTSKALSTVWGPGHRGDVRYLRVWISRLRRKLETNEGGPPVAIKTMQGIGYMLDAEATPGPSLSG